MKYSYLIIDDDPQSILKTQAIASVFQNLSFVASATNYEDGLNLILEHLPKIVFLEINTSKKSNLSLLLINELYRYLKVIPKIIITSKTKELAFEAIKYQVFDYFMQPVAIHELRKCVLKLEKLYAEELQFFNDTETPVFLDFNAATLSQEPSVSKQFSISDETVIPTKEEKDIKPLIIGVKSYGDYRFIEAKDVCYLKADNNSTDIHLHTGEIITSFKTLKHFERILALPFVRIHNSFIVNINYVSRIHTGNGLCYIKNTTIKLPFSKSYKENVDDIIESITKGNYLEI